MKKFIIHALLILVCSMSVFASGTTAVGSLGPKARLGIVVAPGLSFARAPGVQCDNAGVRGAFMGGLQFDYYFAANYGFTAGIYFDYVGARLKYNLLDSAGNSKAIYYHTYTSQFIEIPIGLKFRTNEFNRLTYYGELGVTPMVLISARANFTPDFDNQPKKEVKVYNSRVYPVDLGVHFGGGVEYNISGSTSILVGLVYKYAFFNHIKDSSVYPNIGLSEDKVFLNSLNLKAGILF